MPFEFQHLRHLQLDWRGYAETRFSLPNQESTEIVNLCSRVNINPFIPLKKLVYEGDLNWSVFPTTIQELQQFSINFAGYIRRYQLSSQSLRQFMWKSGSTSTTTREASKQLSEGTHKVYAGEHPGLFHVFTFVKKASSTPVDYE